MRQRQLLEVQGDSTLAGVAQPSGPPLHLEARGASRSDLVVLPKPPHSVQLYHPHSVDSGQVALPKPPCSAQRHLHPLLERLQHPRSAQRRLHPLSERLRHPRSAQRRLHPLSERLRHPRSAQRRLHPLSERLRHPRSAQRRLHPLSVQLQRQSSARRRLAGCLHSVGHQHQLQGGRALVQQELPRTKSLIRALVDERVRALAARRLLRPQLVAVASNSGIPARREARGALSSGLVEVP